MGADDDQGCEHAWQLAGVALIPGNGGTDYVCTRCDAVLYVGPADPMPDTV